jgi:hypothetical protein
MERESMALSKNKYSSLFLYIIITVDNNKRNAKARDSEGIFKRNGIKNIIRINRLKRKNFNILSPVFILKINAGINIKKFINNERADDTRYSITVGFIIPVLSKLSSGGKLCEDMTLKPVLIARNKNISVMK